MLKNYTWEICDVPKSVNLISAKWVYKIKVVSNSKPTKLKTRLVGHGFQQKTRIGYNEVFAHVAKWNTIHITLSMVANNNWDIIHLDVKIAFLNNNLK
jgi:hypothetical protein